LGGSCISGWSWCRGPGPIGLLWRLAGEIESTPPRLTDLEVFWILQSGEKQ
jgi:hypothetical protein